MGGKFDPRKQLRGTVPAGETGLVLRTKKEEYHFYPRSGIIACHGLQPSDDGRTLETGRRKWTLTREFLKSRDDIALMLIRTLTNWRGTNNEKSELSG